jgi:hypothetical protein
MSQQFGWFKNKYQSGGGATFTPNVNLNEVITANGFQYQAIITSNIPNATIKYDMTGTILTTEIEDGLTTANITLDTNGAFTLIKDFNTVVSANTHTFSLALANPNNNAVFASGNTITLSGNINKRIDVVSYTGSNTDIAKSNISVGLDTYTLYQFQNPGAYTFDITSVPVEKEIQVFTVDSGGGGANATFQNPGGALYAGGGGGAGGYLYTANLTTTENRLVCNVNIGKGGITTLRNSSASYRASSSNASQISIHNESNTLLVSAGYYDGVYGLQRELGQGFINDGGFGLSGGGGGYSAISQAGSGNEVVYVANTPPALSYYRTNDNSLGGAFGEPQHSANAIFNYSGGLDSLQPISWAGGTGNALPLSYANTSVTGNANIIYELTGEVHTFSSSATGAGGVDFIFDFTGANASYSGGAGGQFDPTWYYTGTKPLYYTGPGAGGHNHISYAGNKINTDGKDGVVMLRHLQNGDRALSMS